MDTIIKDLEEIRSSDPWLVRDKLGAYIKKLKDIRDKKQA